MTSSSRRLAVDLARSSVESFLWACFSARKGIASVQLKY